MIRWCSKKYTWWYGDKLSTLLAVCCFQFIEDREFFSELAMLVLLDDMPDLMALFMDHGLDLVEFVTDDRLCYLYEQVRVMPNWFCIHLCTRDSPMPRRDEWDMPVASKNYVAARWLAIKVRHCTSSMIFFVQFSTRSVMFRTANLVSNFKKYDNVIFLRSHTP